jgi:hypothetical protein
MAFLLGPCTIKLIVAVFAAAIHFRISLLFVGKDRSLPLDWNLTRGSTKVGSSLACKVWTNVEVNGSGKHSSLLLYGRDKFYSTYFFINFANVSTTLVGDEEKKSFIELTPERSRVRYSRGWPRSRNGSSSATGGRGRSATS